VVAMGTEAEPEEMPEYEPGTAADKVEVAMGKEAAARRLAAAARGSVVAAANLAVTRLRARPAFDAARRKARRAELASASSRSRAPSPRAASRRSAAGGSKEEGATSTKRCRGD
jgi:hypothetical protein